MIYHDYMSSFSFSSFSSEIRLETTVIYALTCNTTTFAPNYSMRLIYMLHLIEFGFGNPSFISTWVERPHISRDSKKDGVKVRF